MASIVPKEQRSAIAFFSQRLEAWGADPAAIGLSSDEVAAIADKVAAAEQAYDEMLQARMASMNATLALRQRIADMRSFGTDLIQVIRAHAELSDGVEVYVAALIPPPRQGSPLGPPPAPRDVRVELDGDGYAHLRWKGDRAGGTAYLIERQVFEIDAPPGAGAWTLIGTSVLSTAVDATVPRGVRQVWYRVRGRRPAGDGPSATSNMLVFGSERWTTALTRAA